MKLICLGEQQGEQESLQQEYKAASRRGEVRLGGSHLFYRYFIKVRYVSYGEIRRAYLREESGESGEFLLKEFYLMLEVHNGVCHKLRMEREVYARAVLSYLQDNFPGIAIGFEKQHTIP